MDTIICPICKCTIDKWQERYDDRDGNYYDCPHCGRYFISGSTLSSIDTLDEKARATLSHRIWRGQAPDVPFFVSSKTLEAVQHDELPNPIEQIDLLIEYMGKQQSSPGRYVRCPYGHIRGKIGSITTSDEIYIVKSASDIGMVDDSMNTNSGYDIRLTLQGWQRFYEIERGAIHSKTAFMAMPFGIDLLTTMVKEVFKPAVEETGFKLKRVDEEPRAGSIDDRIRVDIRLSRFLIADLTHGNQGAYWEAGYAEGLGKPVIYTCSRDHFESQGTHFDTNHHQTVVWDPDDPARAGEDLKATIRATLPFEAVMPKEEIN